MKFDLKITVHFDVSLIIGSLTALISILHSIGWL